MELERRMMQPTLFDPPRARTADPVTSHRAARRVRSVKPSLEARILDVLEGRPLTDDQICQALGIEVRFWPSVKTARSRLTHSVPPRVRETGIVRDHQTVWRRADEPLQACTDNVNVDRSVL